MPSRLVSDKERPISIWRVERKLLMQTYSRSRELWPRRNMGFYCYELLMIITFQQFLQLHAGKSRWQVFWGPPKPVCGRGWRAPFSSSSAVKAPAPLSAGWALDKETVTVKFLLNHLSLFKARSFSNASMTSMAGWAWLWTDWRIRQWTLREI